MSAAQPLSLACPDCAAQMPDTAAFCPGCGRPMSQATSRALPRSGPADAHQGDLRAVFHVDAPKREDAQESVLEDNAQEKPRARGKVGMFSENIAGALAYVTFIPAVVFLLVEPYNRNRFVRFHSIQSVSLWAAGIVLAAALKLSGLVLFHVPMLGPLLMVLLWGMVGLAVVLIWLVLVVKALQGEMFELPFLGRFAEWNADPPSEM